MANRPRTRANDITGDFGQFTEFMKRLMAIPHSEVKAALDAEKKQKAERQSRSSALASGRVSSEKD